MCLYGSPQCCSVYGEEKGSKNWSLRNDPEGTPLQATLKDLWGIGFKPVKSRVSVLPSDERVDRGIWWLTVSKWQLDPEKLELSQSARIQWLTVMQSRLNVHFWNLIGSNSTGYSVEWKMIPGWKQLVDVFCYEWEVFSVVFKQWVYPSLHKCGGKMPVCRDADVVCECW